MISSNSEANGCLHICLALYVKLLGSSKQHFPSMILKKLNNQLYLKVEFIWVEVEAAYKAPHFKGPQISAIE